MKIPIPDDVRKAAEVVQRFISEEQRKHVDGSFEYKQLNDYYDAASAFTEKELEL